MQSNTFDEVLYLEEQFYEDGFQQGLADGAKAGRIEGRTFGLEKGFEKYVESGRLYGKSLIWTNRLPQFQRKGISPDQNQPEPAAERNPTSHDDQSFLYQSLPPLPDNQRLAKHLKVLYALAESESLSTENTEEAVSDFDDRMKRAHAKAKIIERMAGEIKGDADGHGKIVSSNDVSIEDVSVLKARH
jgi:hypothetical protein